MIRGSIGFQGLLMSDDVSMGALSGTLAERSRAALAAGCDVVLHCNGKLDEMAAVAASAGAGGRGRAARRSRAWRRAGAGRISTSRPRAGPSRAMIGQRADDDA